MFKNSRSLNVKALSCVLTLALQLVALFGKLGEEALLEKALEADLESLFA